MVIIGFHLSVQFQWNPEPGWKAVKGTKNILWFVKYCGDRYLAEWILKPLYNCPRCMASIHSTYVYFTLGTIYIAPQLTGDSFIYLYPVYILMLSGMVEIVVRKFEI